MAVYGDTSGALRGHAHAGGQNIALEDDIGGIAYGDAHQLLGHAQGGDDHLVLGASFELLFGDAHDMYGHARGGNDTMIGSLGQIEIGQGPRLPLWRCLHHVRPHLGR